MSYLIKCQKNYGTKKKPKQTVTEVKKKTKTSMNAHGIRPISRITTQLEDSSEEIIHDVAKRGSDRKHK